MGTAAKRIGRPSKPARKGRTYQIGVIVTGETKAIIDKAAKDSGRTISRQVEAMIERCLAYDRTLAAMGTTIEAIKKGSLDVAFRQAGYVPIHTHDGTLWAPPGHPATKHTFPPEESSS